MVDSVSAGLSAGLDPLGDELAIQRQQQRLLAKLFGVEADAPRLQHYVLLEELGRGGMGVVYEAYDRKLDRKVAIKLLGSQQRGSEAKSRLEREAYGLAKLSHPNVVQIHEIGEHEGTLFLVMEFVVGRTLRQWLDEIGEENEPGHGVEAKIELLLQAGRGLVAAHTAGLVHRDFKPANVMVGDDGRARVLDFGLVRGARRSPAENAELVATANSGGLDTEGDAVDGELATAGEGRSLQRSLTERGTIMGTPAYMAPEQHAGRPCDASADQFAFCLVAFEVLYGRRPFTGKTLEELAAAVYLGEVCVPDDEAAAEVPARVREAILRGLCVDAGQRWPELQALLDEFERSLAEQDGSLRGLRRRWAGLALGLSALAVALTVGLMPATEQPQICAIDHSALAKVWDDERRGALRERFLATDLSFAEPIFDVTEQGLDAWADEWVEAQRDACEATRISGVQSELVLDKRTACLDRKRRQLGAIVDAVLEADTEVVAKASDVLMHLPELGSCSDPASLDLPFLRPSEGRALETLRAFEAKLDRARAQRLIGERADAQALVDELLVSVADYAYTPLTLEVRALAAEMLLDTQDFKLAVPAMLAVAREAEALRLDDLVATVRVLLAKRLAGDWSEPDKERWLVAEAEAALRRIGREEDPRELELLEARARLRSEQGDHEGALKLYTWLQDHSKAANAHMFGLDIADELAALGHSDRAEAACYATLDFVRTRYGDNAPDVAPIERNLGLLALEGNDLEAADLHLQRALDIYSKVFGASSLFVAQTRFPQAKLAMMRGEYTDARAGFDAALLIFETELGPSHRYTAQALNGLAMVSFHQGAYRASLMAYERALLIQLELLGPLHEEVGLQYSNIGETRLGLGEHEQALDDFGRALAVLSSTPDHPFVMLPYKGYGQALLHLGRFDEAAQNLELALAIAERSPEESYDTADVRLTLARALVALGREPHRAHELAGAAREVFVDLGESDRIEMADSILAQP